MHDFFCETDGEKSDSRHGRTAQVSSPSVSSSIGSSVSSDLEDVGSTLEKRVREYDDDDSYTKKKQAKLNINVVPCPRKPRTAEYLCSKCQGSYEVINSVTIREVSLI